MRTSDIRLPASDIYLRYLVIMELLDLFFQKADLYLLFWGRVTGLFLTAIPFNSRNIPVQIKVWLAAFVAFFLFMSYWQEPITVAPGLVGYLFQFLSELLIGAAIGFLTQIAFAIFQVAGQFIDMQTGFGIVNVIDPQSGLQFPVIGTFKYIIAVIFFLSINGHHYLLAALNQSYHYLPLGEKAQISEPLIRWILNLGGGMFSTAFKIALPILGALFIADLALGVIARTVPQMNVFLVGMPFKIGLGLALVLIMMPLLVWAFGRVFAGLFEDLTTIMILLGR
ncbi:MAG TPA: flagellar type III secretion system protein FliR [Syntrophomonadaceae bacterium]|nr:flagellar type III secretion system protein FliR [Syntrophomonadaceae bacterium]